MQINNLDFLPGADGSGGVTERRTAARRLPGGCGTASSQMLWLGAEKSFEFP